METLFRNYQNKVYLYEPSRSFSIVKSSLKYPISNRLGGGGFGEVYSINYNQKSAAIKIMPLDCEFDISAAVREISILKRLANHEFILPVYTVQTDITSCGIITPLLIDLKDKLLEEPLPNPTKSIHELITAVSYIHSRDICHRDIKPRNVLYSKRTDQIYLADFGSATVLNCVAFRPLTHEVITIYYRPPEILLGAYNYKYSADIWSLGCTIYYMLTQKILFEGIFEDIQIREIVSVLGTPHEIDWPEVVNLPEYNLVPEKVTPNLGKLKNLTDSWQTLILSCLQYNPCHRPTALELLNNTIFENVTSGYLPQGLSYLDNLYLREPSHKQTQITPSIRATILDWLLGVTNVFKLNQKSFILTVQLIDTYYIPMPLNQIQVYSSAMMYTAAIWTELNPIDFEDYVDISDNAYTKEQLKSMIMNVLLHMQYDLIISTPADFLLEYCRLFYSSEIESLSQLLLNYLIFFPNLNLSYHQQALLAIYYACVWYDQEYHHQHLLSYEQIAQNLIPFETDYKVEHAVNNINHKYKFKLILEKVTHALEYLK